MSENASLTKREMEILRKLANGFTSLMIANELNISESTLRSHYQSIQKKRNLSNHNQLLVYAVKNFT
jgi:two-component system nitrate/nitrite response regulator NarL